MNANKGFKNNLKMYNRIKCLKCLSSSPSQQRNICFILLTTAHKYKLWCYLKFTKVLSSQSYSMCFPFPSLIQQNLSYIFSCFQKLHRFSVFCLLLWCMWRIRQLLIKGSCGVKPDLQGHPSRQITHTLCHSRNAPIHVQLLWSSVLQWYWT